MNCYTVIIMVAAGIFFLFISRIGNNNRNGDKNFEDYLQDKAVKDFREKYGATAMSCLN
jgi:hypothetical protein